MEHEKEALVLKFGFNEMWVQEKRNISKFTNVYWYAQVN